jgi:very-short-patch-repair endonuclease
MRFERHRGLIEIESKLAEETEKLQEATQKIWQVSERVDLVESHRLVHKSLGKYLATASAIMRWWHSFRLKRNLVKDLWTAETLEWLSLCVSYADLVKEKAKYENFKLSTEQITELDEKWVGFSEEFICNRVLLATNSNKRKFLQLGKDLQATGQNQFSANTLEIAPAWATTALTISKDFKLLSQSIDTLVIDEASQTSFSAAIPLIYRANKLILLGDPNQLEPVMQMNDSDENAIGRISEVDLDFLREKSLNHRKNSVFAAFSENSEEEAHFLLDEHYRCHSVIAHWFNSQFYNGRLLLLGSRNLGIEQGIRLNPTYGELVRAGISWENHQEASKVVEILRTQIDPSMTVGVVTPFRAQADLIRRLVKKAGIESEIVINTAHKFQGSERDVMIYSTVITEKTIPNTFNWLKDQKNLINVAVSRAKELLFVVGNPEAAKNPKTPELAALWEAAEGAVDIEDAASWIQTDAERALFNGLFENGILATPQMRIGGLTVDLAVSSGMVNLAIEVDGKSHFDERGLRVRADLQRDRILRDHGWTVYRVPNWRVYSELTLVVHDIKQKIEMF